MSFRQQDVLRVPVSTYRLQFNPSFTFSDAAAAVEYLDRLGVTDCYASPLLKARPGSQHGYDVIDPTELNPELGGRERLAELGDALRSRRMGLLMDVVPNHLCIAGDTNRWWLDVLENGPGSSYSRYFDIDWSPPRLDLAQKVLLPVLGDQFGRVLENRQIQVEFAGGTLSVRVYDTVLPLAPRSWPAILRPAADELTRALGEGHEDVLELESILTALNYLPPRTETDEEKLRERQREKEVIRRRLASLAETSRPVSDAIKASLEGINGRAGDPRSFDALEALLAEQPYRLSYWRVAADEINYRRFFDINDLAALREEDPEVFAGVHRLILDLIQQGWVTGLRIDHMDGLFDPRRYLGDLQVACLGALGISPDAGKRFFIVVEKILLGDERLRQEWAAEGTTGYGFLNFVNGLFVYRPAERAFRKLYQRFTGETQRFDDLARDSKRLILRVGLSSELNVMARRLDRICEQHRHSRDFTLESLRFALREVLACFPIYRTYVTEEQLSVDEEDRRHILAAIRAAKRANPATSESLFDVIGSLLLLEDPEGLTSEQKAERRLFVMRFQQFTGPVMAKALEDTAFYRYFPLASLNEVGGDPKTFGSTPVLFHRKSEIRLKGWPNALLATSTHDTKRSEDVRARISVLSEIPGDWYMAINRWSEWNQPHKTPMNDGYVPSRNDEYLLYQTLVGVWPLLPTDEVAHAEFTRRIQGYMEKATKEAKLHTSWLNPNQAYDDALRSFVASVLDPRSNNAFLADLQKFVSPVARAGMLNSLSQVLLKICSPGVPDFYQGTEIWDFSLVDPDNRRPVDFELRRRMLDALDAHDPAGREDFVRRLAAAPEDGAIKLWVTSRSLRFRCCHRELFARGAYYPVRTAGGTQGHVVAFARRAGEQTAIAAAARFFLRLKSPGPLPVGPEVWGDSVLVLPSGVPPGTYRDVLTGRRVESARRKSAHVLPLAEVFGTLTAVLLERVTPEFPAR